MKLIFYDIIAKVVAAQRFLALELLALGRKCHEMCGYVTFYEICGVRCTPNSRQILRRNERPRCAKCDQRTVANRLSIRSPRRRECVEHFAVGHT